MRDLIVRRVWLILELARSAIKMQKEPTRKRNQCNTTTGLDGCSRTAQIQVCIDSMYIYINNRVSLYFLSNSLHLVRHQKSFGTTTTFNNITFVLVSFWCYCAHRAEQFLSQFCTALFVTRYFFAHAAPPSTSTSAICALVRRRQYLCTPQQSSYNTSKLASAPNLVYLKTQPRTQQSCRNKSSCRKRQTRTSSLQQRPSSD